MEGKKGFPYLLSSVEPRADPSVQAVSQQVTIIIVIHPVVGCHYFLPGLRLTSQLQSWEVNPLAGTILYCLVTEAHRCEQLAQGCHAAFASSTI